MLQSIFFYFSNFFLLSSTSYHPFQTTSQIEIYHTFYYQIPLYLIVFYQIDCHIMTHRIVTYRKVYYHAIIPRIVIYLVLLVILCYRISIFTHFISLRYSRFIELTLLTISTFIIIYTNRSCHSFHYSSSSFYRCDSRDSPGLGGTFCDILNFSNVSFFVGTI